MKKKILFGIVILAILCSVVFGAHYFLFDSLSSNDINKYEKLTEDKTVLPKIEDLGSYNDIEFKYYHKNMLIFSSDAYILKASYDKENYQKEKEEFSENYVYEEEMLTDYRGYSQDPNFEMDKYSFKMLSYDEYGLQPYPHDMIFIGMSDESQEVAVIYYSDTDLDCVDSSFSDFLRSECGWE